jgi:hypothetical protein
MCALATLNSCSIVQRCAKLSMIPTASSRQSVVNRYAIRFGLFGSRVITTLMTRPTAGQYASNSLTIRVTVFP